MCFPAGSAARARAGNRSVTKLIVSMRAAVSGDPRPARRQKKIVITSAIFEEKI